jgi:Legionella pneumophila major outer membrane protein precursor
LIASIPADAIAAWRKRSSQSKQRVFTGGVRAMQKFTKLTFLLCLALITAAISQTARADSTEDRILARLNALEKENAALRARVNRLEAAKATTKELPRTSALDNPAPVVPPPVVLAATPVPTKPRPLFEVSGSLLFLQPSAGDFEQYATVANPFPVPSPNWSNQSINPKYSPAFRIGLRYMPTELDDIALDWTHLNATDNASVIAAPNQFVGPPYSVGPPAGVAFTNGSANGSLQSQYDAANLAAGHTFCADCPFQLRVFGGVEFARLGETVTGTFLNAPITTSHSYTSNSVFTGAGPRLGVRGQYNVGQLQFFGEAAGAGLIGTSQSNINFTTASPVLLALGITNNYQTLTSPNATAVVPSFDAKVGTAYIFPFNDYGLFKVEAGYQVAVYFNAVNEYALSNVSGAPLNTGVYLVTEQQLKTNMTIQGPYFQGSWLF